MPSAHIAPSTRIALVSDIHGNLPALEAVHADLRRRGADLVVNLGDCLSGPLLARETAQFLQAQGWPTVAGNHDRNLIEQSPAQLAPPDACAHAQLGAPELAWLRTLPATLREADLFFCHATPQHNCSYLLETVLPGGAVRLASPSEIAERLGDERAAFIACGHTHFPRAVRTAAGQWIVNPGSVGLPAFEDDSPCLHRIETGSPDARYALAERTAQGWSVALISVPYDHRSMAQLARSRGFADWAVALETGYMKFPEAHRPPGA